MEHLESYNEGLFNWRRKSGKKPLFREFSKDDIYIKSINYKRRIGPSQLKDSNTFYGLPFPDISLSMIKQHIVKHIWSKGVFGDFGYSFDSAKYGGISDVRDTSVWYDVGDTFINLRKIGDELGYKLNQPVHVVSTQKDSKIIEIINFAFYFRKRGIDVCYTLLYKVEGDDSYYQIGQIDKLEGKSDKNIVDEVIEENFLELMDDGLISFSSQKFTNRNNVAYKCLVKVSRDMTPEILFKISECLLVAARRLSDMNIDIDIKSMQHTEDRNTKTGTTDIEFTAIQR